MYTVISLFYKIVKHITMKKLKKKREKKSKKRRRPELQASGRRSWQRKLDMVSSIVDHQIWPSLHVWRQRTMRRTTQLTKRKMADLEETSVFPGQSSSLWGGSHLFWVGGDRNYVLQISNMELRETKASSMEKTIGVLLFLLLHIIGDVFVKDLTLNM